MGSQRRRQGTVRERERGREEERGDEGWVQTGIKDEIGRNSGKKNEKREKKGGRVEMLNTRQWKWKWDERGEESRPLERDFYFQSLFLAFQSPLTSINPLDFQNLMEVKLRIEAESRREDYCKLQRPDSPCGIVTLFSVCQKTISAHLPSFKTRWTLTVMISEQTMDTCPSTCSISKLCIKKPQVEN